LKNEGILRQFSFSGTPESQGCMIFNGLFPRLQSGMLAAIIAASVFAGTPLAAAGDDAGCIGCHTTRGLAAQFPDAEKLLLTIDAAVLKGSVHAEQDCTACHTGIRQFPHPKKTAVSYREFQLETSRQCETCHAEQGKEELDSNHARALAAGNTNAAVCIDCHGSHAVSKPASPRHRISTSCGRCHGAIYTQRLKIPTYLSAPIATRPTDRKIPPPRHSA
jgi:hypothetical protein